MKTPFVRIRPSAECQIPTADCRLLNAEGRSALLPFGLPSSWVLRPSPLPLALWLLALCSGLSVAVRATIPEPDNLLWGAIYFGANQVTASQTNVVVEARRTLTGSALSSGRLGENPAAGHWYSLALALESGSTVLDPLASQTSHTLFIVVRDGATVRYTKSFTVGARGQVTRLDFGEIDTDGNGLLDDWEQRYFGATGQNPNTDPDQDTLNNRQEFQSGTDPLTADIRHPADLNPTNNLITIHEVTSYALAWKLGQPWPIAPANIDLNYVTRAGYLWKNGEEYRVDLNAATNPPLWWVSGQQVHMSAKSAGQAGSAITRTLPGAFRPNDAVPVTLDAVPAREVSCYAVQEQVPAGCDATDISHDGQFDPTNRVIRWGPFFEAERRSFSYHLTPANTADEVAFDGAGSFDGAPVDVSGRVILVRRGFVRFSSIADDRLARKVRLTLQGESSRPYVIEATDDLRTWQAVGSPTADDNGRGEFTTSAGAAPHRFYRARPKAEAP